MLPAVLFVLGAAVGSYGTVIGAGGGFLLLPLLLLFYPADPVTSLAGRSLAVVALNALSGSLAYARKGRVDFPLGFRLAAASVPGTAAGAPLTRFVPRGVFELAFGVVLLLVVVLLLRRSPPEEARAGVPRPGGRPAGRPPRRVGLGMVLSGLIGALSGVMGIGGSPLQVVVLTHPMGVPVSIGMPTAQFTVLLSALGGVAAHLAQGHLDPDPLRLGTLGAGVLVGAQLGAALAERLSTRVLLRLLALAVLSVSVRLILKAA